MPPLDQGFTRHVLKIEWKTSGIHHACVCLARSILGCCETQPAWHRQRLWSQRPQWVCENKVALPWRLALKHLYLYSMACAGREAHTEASEGAASRGVDKERVWTQKWNKSWTQLRPFRGSVLSLDAAQSTSSVFPSITDDRRRGGKWNLLRCEPQHCLFKWGLEKKQRSAGQESREDWEGGVKIRSPAGAPLQGHLCRSAGPVGSKARLRGCSGTGRSPRNASGRSPAIPEADAHLSGMLRSDC